MEKYYFLYKNSFGQWNSASNPVFIAKHTYCRAIPKEVINEIGYDFIGDFVMKLNNNDIKSKYISILNDWDLL